MVSEWIVKRGDEASPGNGRRRQSIRIFIASREIWPNNPPSTVRGIPKLHTPLSTLHSQKEGGVETHNTRHTPLPAFTSLWGAVGRMQKLSSLRALSVRSPSTILMAPEST